MPSLSSICHQADIRRIDRIGIFLLLMLGRLPFALRRKLGACLGDLARFILNRRREIVARNLLLAFPELPEQKRRVLLCRHFQLTGQVFLDECAMLGMSEEKVQQWLPINEEILCCIKPNTICLAPHFVGFAVIGLAFARLLERNGIKTSFCYRPLHNKFWDRFYYSLRSKYGATAINMREAMAPRNCVRELKKDRCLFYMPDIDPGRRKHVIFTGFLGMDNTATTMATSRLAAMSGAQVRVFISNVVDDGYRFQLSPPLAPFGIDAVEDTRLINKLIGESVRLDPAQYYWLHRRFKTRPEGEKDIYA